MLAAMPLELKLRGKSTTQSYHTPIYYVDLVVRSGMILAEAVTAAQEFDRQRKAAGLDQAALDDAARVGFANGAFEESEEDASDVAEEFFPDQEGGDTNGGQPSSAMSLSDKLKAKVDTAP